MDLDVIEGLNEIRPSIYRVAMKLLSLQRLCHLHVVYVRHVMAAFSSLDGTGQQDVRLSRQEVTRALSRMFDSASQEVLDHVIEETCDVILRLFDGSEAASVSAVSLQAALVALSADALLAKYRALVRLCENPSGSISRSGLRSLLYDLRQVPAAVQEEVVFGAVEEAVRSCFNGVLTPTVSAKHLMSWLQNEPRLLLWLPTLYRLCVSQNVSHMVRCHTCKTFPITGLRYRCLKCVNVHVCQSCFLSQRQTRKHKPPHPVLEFCTQPTWRESLSSLVRSARHTLLPRRYTQREADRRVLMWAEPGETQNRAPPPSDASPSLDETAVRHSSCSSKALQTDEVTADDITVVYMFVCCVIFVCVDFQTLTTDVRNLQRDKWLLEQEMQAWRLTVQSEHSILEDRCSEMEVTMETLRQQNVRLQILLAQTLNKTDDQQHASDTPHASADTEKTGRDDITSDTEINSEEDKEHVMDEWSEDESQTPPPTIHQGVSPAHEGHCEEGSLGDRHLCRPIEREEGDTRLPEEEKDYETRRPEELLQQTVDRLKTKMETDRWRDRQTGPADASSSCNVWGQSQVKLCRWGRGLRGNTAGRPERCEAAQV
ncbi:dystrotelin isoform X2 [Hippoglossus stenolepis]|uniref:dystrotelin isoform X2 n=1 Tax=Hippoglossus stenolepis TaxID=195615 RepID=UPI001FAE8FA7|nr:dystrotelin isoform X2 [Hippoglossus stenolepis]